MKYIVIELQTDASGNVANIVTKKDTLNEAEALFHQILASAAISSVPVHAAVILNNYGDVQDVKSYVHPPEG